MMGKKNMNYNKVAVRLLAMIAIISNVACYADETAPIKDPLRAEDPLVVDGSPQMWALATDAIHSSTQNAGLNRLRWGSATKANIEYRQKRSC